MVTPYDADIKKPVDKLGKNFYVALILLVLTGIYMNYLMFDEIINPGNPLGDFPQRIGEWENTGNHSLGTDVLDILKVDDYILRDYKNPDGVISSLYIGYYQSHRRSAEIHTPENCQAGGGWVVLSEKKKTIDVSGRGVKLISWRRFMKRTRRRGYLFTGTILEEKPLPVSSNINLL